MLLFMETCSGQQPSINANGVLDAAIYTGGIAPGGLFVIRGSNLSASGAHCASLPLPTRLAGVSISFVPLSGGAGIDAFLWCAYNQDGVNQLTGLLPSTVVPGDYNAFVISDGSISEPAKVTVVSRKFGILTASGTGNGRAVVQTYISPGRLDLNRFTTGIYTGMNPVITQHSPVVPVLFRTVGRRGACPDGPNDGCILVFQTEEFEHERIADLFVGREVIFPMSLCDKVHRATLERS